MEVGLVKRYMNTAGFKVLMHTLQMNKGMHSTCLLEVEDTFKAVLGVCVQCEEYDSELSGHTLQAVSFHTVTFSR